ncbi:hypothetical protein AcV7_001453 [Taiwanofungus camphoratus]|nr:hypothetical protein AcV7_001453 [Antrodia cinnamomea]
MLDNKNFNRHGPVQDTHQSSFRIAKAAGAKNGKQETNLENCTVAYVMLSHMARHVLSPRHFFGRGANLCGLFVCQTILASGLVSDTAQRIHVLRPLTCSKPSRQRTVRLF